MLSHSWPLTSKSTQCERWHQQGTLFSHVYVSWWAGVLHLCWEYQQKSTSKVPFALFLFIPIYWAYPGMEIWCSLLGSAQLQMIFNALADALLWVTTLRGATYLKHFLDDFITAGTPTSLQRIQSCWSTRDLFSFPIATDKQEGPTTFLTFLGFEVDTMLFKLRIPAQKLKYLKATLRKWLHLKSCRKKELQSLVRLLHDTNVVIHPGCTFLRPLPYTFDQNCPQPFCI